jgi:hypothetical protein
MMFPDGMTHSQVVKDLRDLKPYGITAGDVVESIYGCIMAEPDTPAHEPDKQLVLDAIRQCLAIWQEVNG